MEYIRSCGDCYYSEQCGCSEVCEYYDPVILTDEYYDYFIEKERLSFLEEWDEYIKEFYE